MSDLPERLRRNHSPDYLRVYKDSCTCQYCRSAREIESLQRELAEKHDEVLALEAAAITPEMRAVLKRAFALAREVEESELAEDLCGLLIESDPYRNPHLNTGGRDLLGEQG